MASIWGPGWTLGEAARRCVSRTTISSYFEARREWLAAGAPRRFIRSPGIHDDVHGAFRRSQHNHRLYKANLATKEAVRRDVWALLQAGRLIATARLGSATSEPQKIPSSAWRELAISSWDTSRVREGKSGPALFDVTVFPILQAPSVAEVLDGKTFAEALDNYVWRDPQAEALRSFAIASNGAVAEFGWSYEKVWPVGYDEKLARSLFINGRRPPGSLDLRSATHADGVVGHRFRTFIQLLADGQIQAEGLPADGGGAEVIPRSVWLHDSFYVGLSTGDLLKSNEERPGYLPIFHALMLRDAKKLASGIPEIVAPKRTLPPRTTANRKAEEKCWKLLHDEMAKSPDRKLKSKAQLRPVMQAKCGSKLSEAAFHRAWTKAVESAEASVWSHAGALPHRKSEPN